MNWKYFKDNIISNQQPVAVLTNEDLKIEVLEVYVGNGNFYTVPQIDFIESYCVGWSDIKIEKSYEEKIEPACKIIEENYWNQVWKNLGEIFMPEEIQIIKHLRSLT